MHVTDTIVLALVTLGGTIKNKNDPICVMPPKITKASTVVTVMWLLYVTIAANFVHVNDPLREVISECSAANTDSLWEAETLSNNVLKHCFQF